LVSWGAVGVIGSGYSSDSETAQLVLRNYDIPQISGSATSDDLSSKAVCPLSFPFHSPSSYLFSLLLSSFFISLLYHYHLFYLSPLLTLSLISLSPLLFLYLLFYFFISSFYFYHLIYFIISTCRRIPRFSARYQSTRFKARPSPRSSTISTGLRFLS
jgi:hypothetical protein